MAPETASMAAMKSDAPKRSAIQLTLLIFISIRWLAIIYASFLLRSTAETESGAETSAWTLLGFAMASRIAATAPTKKTAVTWLASTWLRIYWLGRWIADAEQQRELCSDNQYRCPGGECISSSFICDGDNDCSDGADEVNCPRCRNAERPFYCPLSDYCVSINWVCDGEKDCRHGEDEENCDKQRPETTPAMEAALVSTTQETRMLLDELQPYLLFVNWTGRCLFCSHWSSDTYDDRRVAGYYHWATGNHYQPANYNWFYLFFSP